MTRDPETGKFRTTQQSRERGSLSNAARTWMQADAPCAQSGSNFVKAMGIVGGAGLGAALMYLMDPNQGAERRHHLSDVAGSALESTTHALRSGAETIGHKAADAGSAIYSQIPSRRDVGQTGHLLWNRAGDAAHSTRDTAGDWLESAREMMPSMPSFGRRSHHRDHGVSATTAGVGGLAALAIGVGAMWLFDPSKGRARRAWMGQKMTKCLNETGSMMRATGRHLANKSRGYYHEGKSMAQGWNAESGSVEPESSAQQRVDPIGPDVSAYRVGSPTTGI